MHAGTKAEPVLVAWGIDTAGKPHLLGLEPGSSESTDAWAAFLRGMVKRGLRPPLLVISDGGSGLIGAVEIVLSGSLAKMPDPPRQEPAGRGSEARPGEGQGGVLGDLERHRGRPRRPGRGRGHPPGQGVQRQVGEALPRGGGVPAGRLRVPHHPRAVPEGALEEDPPLQLHRADLRGDPPAGEGDRSAPRGAELPVAGVGGARPGQPGMAGRGHEPARRSPAAGSPTGAVRTTRPPRNGGR